MTFQKIIKATNGVSNRFIEGEYNIVAANVTAFCDTLQELYEESNVTVTNNDIHSLTIRFKENDKVKRQYEENLISKIAELLNEQEDGTDTFAVLNKLSSQLGVREQVFAKMVDLDDESFAFLNREGRREHKRLLLN